MNKKRLFRFLLVAVIIMLTSVFIMSACDSSEKPNGGNSSVSDDNKPDEGTPDEGTPDEGTPDEGETPESPDTEYSYLQYSYEGENYFPYSTIEGISYGETQHISYYSKFINEDKHANVTLPIGYDENKTYPVLYLLHGLMSDEYSWLRKNAAREIVQNAAYFGEASEMIIVSVNSIVAAGEKEPSMLSQKLTIAYDMTGRDIVECLMPYIEANYSVKTGRENTAVAGFSMGGREALLAAFAYQDVFGYVGAFSSAAFGTKLIDFSSDYKIPDFNVTGEDFLLIMLAIGTRDTSTGGVTQAISAKMTELEIEHIYYTMAGGHDYSVWRNNLYNFVRRIFPSDSQA